MLDEKWALMDREVSERISRERDGFEKRLAQERSAWSERLANEAGKICGNPCPDADKRGFLVPPDEASHLELIEWD